MDFHDCLLPAVEQMLARDMPEEAFGDAIASEARLMAGARPDANGASWDD